MSEGRRVRAVKHFAAHTGIHSVNSISEARSNFRRILWSCVLLAALTVYVYQLNEMMHKYMAHPVKTTTTIDYKMPMDFPAVTICNLNPLKGTLVRSKKFQEKKRRDSYSKLRRSRRQVTLPPDEVFTETVPGTEVPDGSEEEISVGGDELPMPTSTPVPESPTNFITTPPPLKNDYEEEDEEMLLPGGDVLPSPTPLSRNSSATTYVREEDEKKAFEGLLKIVDTKPSVLVESPNWANRTTAVMRKDAVVQAEFLFYMNSINKNIRKELTYDLEDLLIDCSFNGRNCVPNDFIRLSNPKFGMCFVFNAGQNATHEMPIRQVNSSGADVGLELTLYVDQNNYITEAAPQAGYKIVIHSPSQPPIPEKDGYVVGPGHFTALGVKLNIFERAPQPYGKCKNFTDAENRAMNMFLTQLPRTKPTLSSCMKTCEQLEIIKECRCYSLMHGFDDAPAFDTVRDRLTYLPACFMGRDAPDFICLTQVMRKVAAGLLPCKSHFCKNKECTHSVYQTSASSASWPAENIFSRFRAVIDHHPNSDIRKLLNRSRVTKAYVQEKLFFESNFLKVRVFFEDLTVVRLKTESSYGIHELLSEIGGQGGLWLGVSVITAFELIELLGDMIRICLCRKQKLPPASTEMA